MNWEILKETLETANQLSENEFNKKNATGSVLGGGAALAAGIAVGITSLPLAVPILIVGGAFAGAAGEEKVKATGKVITDIFGEATKKIGSVLDFFKSDEDFFYRGVEFLNKKASSFFLRKLVMIFIVKS